MTLVHMMSTDSDNTAAFDVSTAIQKSHRILRLLAISFMASALIYIVVSWFLVLSGTIKPARVDGIIPGLALAALLSPFIGYILRTSVLAKADRKNELQARLSLFGQATIVYLAFAELTAILGMVLSILCREVVWASTFGSIAIFIILLLWPDQNEMERFVKTKKV